MAKDGCLLKLHNNMAQLEVSHHNNKLADNRLIMTKELEVAMIKALKLGSM